MVGGRYFFNILKRRCSSSRKRRSSSSRSSSRRGGREMLRTTGFDSLPDDILMQILIRIPAKDIVDSTKFVCRKWHEITLTRDFAYAHLHLSTPGLLVQNHLKTATFMSLTKGNHQVQISDFNHTSRGGYFWTSCNGLTLEPKTNDGRELMITNPVTRHRFDLPPIISNTIHPNLRSAIAYVATRKEYKVVRTYYPTGGDHSRPAHCAILTVGVDNSWRLIDTQHLSPMESKKLINWSTLDTEGFVHWVQNYDSYNKNHIQSLNMETEVMTQIPVPRSNSRYYYDYKYLSAGSSLSLLIGDGRLKWEVWEMKPLESGEYCWTKLPDIDLEAQRDLLNEWCRKEVNDPLFKHGDKDDDCLDCRVSPSGWLKYPEVIAFYAFQHLSSCRFHIVYDVQTKDVSLYKSEYGCSFPHVVHRNSLVWIC